MVADQGLARAGIGKFNGLVHKNFGATGLANANGVGMHGSILFLVDHKWDSNFANRRYLADCLLSPSRCGELAVTIRERSRLKEAQLLGDGALVD